MNVDKIHLHEDMIVQCGLANNSDMVIILPYRGYTISLCLDNHLSKESPGGSIRVYYGPEPDATDLTKQISNKLSRDHVGLPNTADAIRTVMNWIDKREGDAHVVYGDQPADPTAKQLLASAGFEKIGTYVGDGKTHDAAPLDLKRAGVLVDGKFVPSQDKETKGRVREDGFIQPVLTDTEMFAENEVTVERLPSIPVGDMPFHHDRASMYTPLVRGWYVLHGGFDTPSSKIGEGWKGAQYPIQRLDLYNTRTGNAFRLHIGDKL